MGFIFIFVSVSVVKMEVPEINIYLLCQKQNYMVKTKGLAATQANWEGAIGSVPGKYSQGVQGASGVIQAAIDAEALYAQKVQEAITNQSRAKGLQQVTDADWKNAAMKKGAARIATGMTEAKGKFNKGMANVLSTIEGVTIAPRTADPMANVDNRVKPIVAALAAMKR